MGNSCYTVEIDQVEAEQWSRWLDLFEDSNLYQTWAYGQLSWGRRQLSHLVVKSEGNVVALAQLRVIRPPNLNIGIAHLRWGPICEPKGTKIEPGVLETVADALYDEYVNRRGLFLRIYPNGFINTPKAVELKSAFSKFRIEPFAKGESYRTLVLDLSPSLEQLRKQFDQKWRNQLNRAEKNGLTLVEGQGEAEFDTMSALFDGMWARKQFDRPTDIGLYKHIQAALPANQKMRVFIAESKGIPVAGAIAGHLGNSGIYLFGGTGEQGMQSKGSYLLQWRIVQWLKESGVRYYNLGGINPETNPGVHHFKNGMAGADLLYLEPMVACRSKIRASVAQMGIRLGTRIRTAAAPYSRRVA